MIITYTRVGDYLLPNIKLRDPPVPLGLFGKMHREFLRENRPILYSRLLLSEKLYPLCCEIDETAKNRLSLGMSTSDILTELVYAYF